MKNWKNTDSGQFWWHDQWITFWLFADSRPVLLAALCYWQAQSELARFLTQTHISIGFKHGFDTLARPVSHIVTETMTSEVFLGSFQFQSPKSIILTLWHGQWITWISVHLFIHIDFKDITRIYLDSSQGSVILFNEKNFYTNMLVSQTDWATNIGSFWNL